MDNQFELKIYKCKNVKTPQKAWSAAGWDFFIPENLSLFDFTKSYKTYLDKSIKHNKLENYSIPLIFYLRSNKISNELIIKLILTWNDQTNEYKFNICNNVYQPDLVQIKEVDNEIMTLLKESDTIITKIEMLPHSKVLIPAGIHVNLPKGVFLNAANKSGIASKRGLIVGASLIDQDYQGEIHINLINTTNETVILKAGEKIVQFVPYFQPQMNEVTEFNSKDELYKDTTSERGEGGFGSSGEK